MAARTTKIRHDENTRAKIQTSQIINRLQDHIHGRVELSSTQVTAARILLAKTLPDVSEETLRVEDNRTTAEFTDAELTAILRGRMRRAETDEPRPEGATVN